MEGKEKTLFLITTSFPFGYGEVSLENEIKVLAECFDKIYIIPQYKHSDHFRKMPANVEVLGTLYKAGAVNARKGTMKNLGFALKTLAGELITSDQKGEVMSNFRKLNSSLGQCLVKADLVAEMLEKKRTPNSYFYSNWMNDGAIIFSILKHRGIIPAFVFRQRGFDLYDERRKGGYMPFRHFNFRMADKIFCIANDGYKYIKQKNIYPEKVRLSHLGVFDNGINPFDNKTFTIVSCSNIIALKRVQLIPEILKHIDAEVKWIHFGDGKMMEEVKRAVAELKPNIKVELRGQVGNAQILEVYRQTPVNLFVHLSETEGGAAVALQEAASFGIPLLGTNAGGIPDIVNETTGILVPVEIDVKRVAALIDDFRTGEKNTPAFRAGVRKFWQEHFDASVNYRKFAEMLTQ